MHPFIQMIRLPLGATVGSTGATTTVANEAPFQGIVQPNQISTSSSFVSDEPPKALYRREKFHPFADSTAPQTTRFKKSATAVRASSASPGCNQVANDASDGRKSVEYKGFKLWPERIAQYVNLENVEAAKHIIDRYGEHYRKFISGVYLKRLSLLSAYEERTYKYESSYRVHTNNTIATYNSLFEGMLDAAVHFTDGMTFGFVPAEVVQSHLRSVINRLDRNHFFRIVNGRVYCHAYKRTTTGENCGPAVTLYRIVEKHCENKPLSPDENIAVAALGEYVSKLLGRPASEKLRRAKCVQKKARRGRQPSGRPCSFTFNGSYGEVRGTQLHRLIACTFGGDVATRFVKWVDATRLEGGQKICVMNGIYSFIPPKTCLDEFLRNESLTSFTEHDEEMMGLILTAMETPDAITIGQPFKDFVLRLSAAPLRDYMMRERDKIRHRRTKSRDYNFLILRELYYEWTAHREQFPVNEPIDALKIEVLLHSDRQRALESRAANGNVNQNENNGNRSRFADAAVKFSISVPQSDITLTRTISEDPIAGAVLPLVPHFKMLTLTAKRTIRNKVALYMENNGLDTPAFSDYLDRLNIPREKHDCIKSSLRRIKVTKPI